MPITPLGPEQLDAVEAALSVEFDDRELLALALTHQSYVNEHPPTQRPDSFAASNERLEFLGDSIVGMVIADRMFAGAPGLPEGDLTVRRSQVVRKGTLALVARTIGLGRWLVMGKQPANSERVSRLHQSREPQHAAEFVVDEQISLSAQNDQPEMVAGPECSVQHKSC